MKPSAATPARKSSIPAAGIKTLICVNSDHADLVVDVLKIAFEARYGTVEDDAVIKITGNADKPLELIRRFKNERSPTWRVTVDLLTTGVDVPEICNLVFLRQVNSRILFDQMLGRATRLCDFDGDPKDSFRVFDAVRIFESIGDMTAMKPVVVDPGIGFAQLERAADHRRGRYRLGALVRDQFIAKLQAKKRHPPRSRAGFRNQGRHAPGCLHRPAQGDDARGCGRLVYAPPRPGRDPRPQTAGQRHIAVCLRPPRRPAPCRARLRHRQQTRRLSQRIYAYMTAMAIPCRRWSPC